MFRISSDYLFRRSTIFRINSSCLICKSSNLVLQTDVLFSIPFYHDFQHPVNVIVPSSCSKFLSLTYLVLSGVSRWWLLAMICICSSSIGSSFCLHPLVRPILAQYALFFSFFFVIQPIS